jgi:hypothetical protein
VLLLDWILFDDVLTGILWVFSANGLFNHFPQQIKAAIMGLFFQSLLDSFSEHGIFIDLVPQKLHASIGYCQVVN